MQRKCFRKIRSVMKAIFPLAKIISIEIHSKKVNPHPPCDVYSFDSKAVIDGGSSYCYFASVSVYCCRSWCYTQQPRSKLVINILYGMGSSATMSSPFKKLGLSSEARPTGSKYLTEIQMFWNAVIFLWGFRRSLFGVGTSHSFILSPSSCSAALLTWCTVTALSYFYLLSLSYWEITADIL